MEVQLYVYDLSRGMARAMSQQFLGIQIDAVYHTALVFDNREWFFGAGIQSCYPGTTHHGRPMEVINMGTTQLPIEVVTEYIDSMKEIYSPESYDLFTHNCNNFTADLSQFMLGKTIPDHITNLPQRVLDTPFGQMLRPQIDASMRTITQAPVPAPPAPRASTQSTQSAAKLNAALASHPHQKIPTPLLQAAASAKPITYSKIPPLDKLMAKLGPLSTNSNIILLRDFIQARQNNPQDVPLPDLTPITTFYRTTLLTQPTEHLFPAIDLLRAATIDPRITGYLAAEPASTATIPTLLNHITTLPTVPSSLRLVTLQLASNIFSTPVSTQAIFSASSPIPPSQSASPLATSLTTLITTSLLDSTSTPTTRAATAGLARNLASAHLQIRKTEGREALDESLQVEIAAAILAELSGEDGQIGKVGEEIETKKGLVEALGMMVWFAGVDGEVKELCAVLGAGDTVGRLAGVGKVGLEVRRLLEG